MIPLYKPFMPEVPLVNKILHSGQLAYGKYGREFEKALSDYFDTPHVIVTNTFNMAILVALTTFGIEPGDTVIASPMACLASTQPLLAAGLKVKWADVNPETGTLCPDSVRSCMQYGPKAIIHNHFCGYVGFIDEINSIGKEYGIPVIDDGIEAFGSEYKGRKIGNTGTDATIFSFNPVRIPNTIDGGSVIFKEPDLFKKSWLVRDAGIDRKRFRDEWGEINPECDIEIAGHSATPNDLKCYIGIQQMKNVDWIVSKQRENAAKWNLTLNDYQKYQPVQTKEVNPNFWVYGIMTENKQNALEFFRFNGFYASSVHFPNNHYFVFQDKRDLPGVEEFYNKFLAIPSGWWLNSVEISLKMRE